MKIKTVFSIGDTGPPAYSDSAGTAIMCHCKQLSLYLMIFNKRKNFVTYKNVRFFRTFGNFTEHLAFFGIKSVL